MSHAVRLAPGTLRDAIVSRSAEALEAGALEPLHTEQRIVPDGGMDFVVRRVDGLMRKPRRGAPHDPFLDPEPGLIVGALSDTHLCLLNKFNVVPHHALIVTRAFVSQEAPLDLADFEVLCRCLAEWDALAFYNGGRTAGASQAHKHLQLVPVPLGPGPDRTPVDAAVAGGRVPFPHALAPWDPEPEGALATHRALLARIDRAAGGAAYNLLATRGWLMAVPRTRERWSGLSINALGFAGSILTKTGAQVAEVERVGPVALLRHVST